MAEERINLGPIGGPTAPKNPPNAGAAAANSGGPADEAYQLLRKLAGMGYQLRASLVGGDRFLAQDKTDDQDTGVWLISCALMLAEEITGEIDGLAKQWKPRPSEPALAASLVRLRTRAHQLHAAVRAADHFLDQDSAEDNTNGSWLVACALGLADKLASETEDLASAIKQAGNEPTPAATVVADVTAPRRANAGARAAVQ
jgi:hypothetical protein